MEKISRPIQSDNIEAPSTKFREVIYTELIKSHNFFNGDYPSDYLNRVMEEVEYIMISFMLDCSKGSIHGASRMFDTSRDRLKSMIERYNIDPNIYKSAHDVGLYGKGFKKNVN